MRLTDEKKWQLISNIVLIVFSVLVLVPFLLLVIASFTDNSWASANGFSFFPKKLSLEAYQYISAQWKTIGRGYLMTILVTLIGTFASIIFTAMFAWGLADENLPGVKIINFLTVFTMLFSGGIVASYYTWCNIFHIRDTIWALILPNYMMSAFNIILIKNYYKFSIPKELIEAARIDGASEIKAFWKIVFPLSVPILITVGMMVGLMYWNDWVNGLYFLTDRDGSKYYTVQIILNQINNNLSFLANNAQSQAVVNAAALPSTTVRMAIALVSILPILVIYPFVQKYLVKGITLGGVKG